MTMTSRVEVKVSASLASALDLLTPVAPLDDLTRIDLESGTASGQADMLFADRRSLAASADEDLDFAGSLSGPLGGTLTFARVKAILIRAAAANAHNLTVSRPADTGLPLFAAAGDSIDIPPGGVFLWAAPGAGVVVTASTGDQLNVANAGAVSEVTYDVVIIGASA